MGNAEQYVHVKSLLILPTYITVVPEPHNKADYEGGPAAANENIHTFRKWSHCRYEEARSIGARRMIKEEQGQLKFALVYH